MDVSCKSETPEFSSEVSCRAGANEIGKDFKEIIQLDKISAVQMMTQGATRISERMLAEEKFQGVIGLGGANGTEIACSVMLTLMIQGLQRRPSPY
jgi:uncharacterized protein (UPF0261 family)